MKDPLRLGQAPPAGARRSIFPLPTGCYKLRRGNDDATIKKGALFSREQQEWALFPEEEEEEDPSVCATSGSFLPGGHLTSFGHDLKTLLPFF